MNTTYTVDIEDELQILLSYAKPRHGAVSVPAGWVAPDEIEALLENGAAWCTDCDHQIQRCTYCGPDEAHCPCTQPGDCIDDDRRSEAGDRLRAEAKEDRERWTA